MREGCPAVPARSGSNPQGRGSSLGHLGRPPGRYQPAQPAQSRPQGCLCPLRARPAPAASDGSLREPEPDCRASRGRFAREMHDSLAQVLGVTHLRLRALDVREEGRDSPEVATELAGLADICQEAYQDVRESILGLGGSNRTERGLLDNLRAYLVRYSQQCDIAT